MKFYKLSWIPIESFSIIMILELNEIADRKTQNEHLGTLIYRLQAI